MTTNPPTRAQQFSALTPDAVAAAMGDPSGAGDPTPVEVPAPESAPTDQPAPDAAPVDVPVPESEPVETPPAEPAPVDPPAPAALDPFAPPPAPTQPETIDFFGVNLSRDEGLALASLYQWAASLTPEQQQAIFEQGASPATAPPAASPPGTPTPAAPDDDEFADPKVAELQQQIAQLSQQTAAQAQSIAQSQYAAQQQQAAIANKPHADRAVADFQTQYQLADADMDLIRQKLFAHPYILENMHAQSNGDVYRTYLASFETVAWTDPTMRDRLINARAVASQTQQDEIAAKRARASAVAGSGGSTPRTSPAASTPEDRRRGMLDELRGAMTANNSV